MALQPRGVEVERFVHLLGRGNNERSGYREEVGMHRLETDIEYQSSQGRNFIVCLCLKIVCPSATVALPALCLLFCVFLSQDFPFLSNSKVRVAFVKLTFVEKYCAFYQQLL